MNISTFYFVNDGCISAVSITKYKLKNNLKTRLHNWQKCFIRNFDSYNLPLLEVYWCTVSWIRFVLGNTRIGWRWNIRLINFLLCIIRLIRIRYGRRCINLFFIHPWSCDLKTQVIKSYDGFFIKALSYHYYIVNIYYTALFTVPVLFSELEENPKMLGSVLQFLCETQTVSDSNKTYCCQLSALHKPSEF